MISLGKNIYGDDAKAGSGHQEKKNVPHRQIIPALKRKEFLDESGFQKAFQKLSNEVINLKKFYSRNPPATKYFRPYKNNNKSHQPQQLSFPPPLMQVISVEEGRMENYRRTHKKTI